MVNEYRKILSTACMIVNNPDINKNIQSLAFMHLFSTLQLVSKNSL